MFELRAKSTKETDVLLYGSISEWGKVRAEDLFNTLNACKARGYEKVNFKINSPGGSIVEGIACVSQMARNDLYVIGTVEGVAASMASVMLQGCHQRRMVKHSRLMVHQGSGGVVGSANFIRDYANLLDSLNKTMADIYASRSKKRDAKYILDNWMKEGVDTWFSAEKALEEGLIDEIVEGVFKPLEKENANLIEMAAHYQSQFDTTENAMNKETRDALIKLYGLKAEATDAEILAAATAAKPATPPATPPAAENKAGATTATTDPKIVDNVVAIAKAKGVTDEKKINGLKLLAQLDVQAALDMIEASGNAPETNIETGKPEQVQNVNELLRNLANNGGHAATDKSKWKWAEWNKPENAKAFAELLEKEPKKYAALFKDEFGYEPSEAELKSIRF